MARPPRRGKVRRGEPTSAADVLHAVLGRMGGPGRAQDAQVFAAWDGAVGDLLRRSSEPEHLRGGLLTVRVASSALAHEVVMLKAPILERLAAALGAPVVKDLRTRVAPLERTDRETATGPAGPTAGPGLVDRPRRGGR